MPQTVLSERVAATGGSQPFPMKSDLSGWPALRKKSGSSTIATGSRVSAKGGAPTTARTCDSSRHRHEA